MELGLGFWGLVFAVAFWLCDFGVEFSGCEVWGGVVLGDVSE